MQEFASDDELLALYEEIMQNVRDDREKVDAFIKSFVDIVINEKDNGHI